jgi:hypothetical protein
MTDRVDYDEFGLFHENAEEYGLPFDRPPTVRRVFAEVAPGRRLSALAWGDADPELVLLHGGSQNAHTWDTVAMALDRPLVASTSPDTATRTARETVRKASWMPTGTRSMSRPPSAGSPRLPGP